MIYRIAALAILVLACAPCAAWSTKVRALQTRLATGLYQGTFGCQCRQCQPSSPSPEDVERQFIKVLTFSESGRPFAEIVYEPGVLANIVQLLTDPSAAANPLCS